MPCIVVTQPLKRPKVLHQSCEYDILQTQATCFRHGIYLPFQRSGFLLCEALLPILLLLLVQDSSTDLTQTVFVASVVDDGFHYMGYVA